MTLGNPRDGLARPVRRQRRAPAWSATELTAASDEPTLATALVGRAAAGAASFRLERGGMPSFAESWGKLMTLMGQKSAPFLESTVKATNA